MNYRNLIFFFIFFLFLPFSVLAYQIEKVEIEPRGDFLILPTKFDLELEAGSKIIKEISIINRSKDDLDFKISIEDFIGSTDEGQGGIELLGDKSGGSFSLRDYLKPEIRDFVLKPSESIKMNVGVDIPQDMPAGGHYAVLLASAKKISSDSTNSNTGVSALSRVGVLFLVNINNDKKQETPQGKASDLTTKAKLGVGQSKGQKKEDNEKKTGLRPLEIENSGIKITFQNKEKTHFAPYGKVSIYNLFNKKIAEIDIKPWYILPSSLREKIVNLPNRFFFGRYTAIAEIFWGDGQKDIQKISFWIFPWRIILGFIALLIILVLSLKFLKRKFIKQFLAFFIFLIFLISSSFKFQVSSFKTYAAMQSSNYKIIEDVISVGGTDSGASTNYQLDETIGEPIAGDKFSTNYQIKSGYRFPTTYFLSISTPPDVTMSSLSQADKGVSTASVSWTVTTDNPNGYQLSLSASTQPAMKTASGDFFADYTPSGGTTDFWSVDSTDSEFGFAVGQTGETDIVDAFKDDGTKCGTGTNLGNAYRGFSGTTPILIVNRTSAAPSGNTTTVLLKAEIGENKWQAAGSYSAEITATATAL